MILNIQTVVQNQRDFFALGLTRNPDYRLKALEKLYRAITEMEEDIAAALTKDLGKSHFESYMTEIGMVKSEIVYMQKHLKKYAKVRRVRTPLAQFHSTSYHMPEPYGNVLIISPWNYPFMLALDPVVDAIAAGNTVTIKPSAYAPATSAVINELISRCFEPSFAVVIEGGRETNQSLLEQPFQYIFFTGSKTVGRVVMEKAAAHLTPVTLELGGKSPCIVDETADLEIAARRIVFGKYLNCGQTCVAPDYLLIHESVKELFLPMLCKQVTEQYGESPLDNPHYGRIINHKHFERLMGLIENEKVVIGGQSDDHCRISPTILDDITLDSPVMREEIFGPILPVLTFQNIEDVSEIIQHNPYPLALYAFTSNTSTKKYLLNHISYGGGCFNDTIIHLATSRMGFGGVGESGMGSYHGKSGFDTFTHYKSIVDKKSWPDIPLRYQPYSEKKMQLLHRFLK